jgi:hypothetical protein
MNTKKLMVCAAMAGALALAVPLAGAQQSAADSDAEEMSDAGVIAPAPYDLEPRVMLRSADRTALRKLEDKHLSELRTLEDRYAKELRALRAKQFAERDAMLKSFASK